MIDLLPKSVWTRTTPGVGGISHFRGRENAWMSTVEPLIQSAAAIEAAMSSQRSFCRIPCQSCGLRPSLDQLQICYRWRTL